MQINYQLLSLAQVKLDLLEPFNRYQDVKQCWRKENNDWILKDIAFIEQWDQTDKQQLVQGLQHTIQTNGVVFGAFDHHQLIGFASVESELFGSKQQYRVLTNLYVSYEMRAKGIGRKLFYLAADWAKQNGAKKLYISAHSSKETQAFYHAIGCTQAQELHPYWIEHEPCDCQLEFLL